MLKFNCFAEEWKDIPDFEGYYQGSTFGRVRSLDRIDSLGHRRYGKILTSKKRGKYRRIQLCKNGAIYQYSVHRLIWKTFNGSIPNGYEINHIDENPSNNRLDNLSLVSHKANINWGTRNERVSKKMTNGKLSKPISQYTLDGVLINTYQSTMEVERLYGFNHSNIEKCCNHKQHFNTAYGYKWEYIT